MIHNLFPTLITENSLVKKFDKKQLLNEIKNTHNQQHSLLTKGTSSYSPSTPFLNKVPTLKSQIEIYIKEYSNIYGLLPLKIHDSWFNIQKKDGKTLRHNHQRSVISGVYYALLEKDTCDIIFHSPLNIYKMHENMESKDHYIDNSLYNKNNYKFPIKQDYLYIFPSWLEHETEVNKGKDRITISFNTEYL